MADSPIGRALSFGLLAGLAGAALLQASSVANTAWRPVLILAGALAPVVLGFAWRRSYPNEGGWATAAGSFVSGAILFVALAGLVGPAMSFGAETWKWPLGFAVAALEIAVLAWPLAVLFWGGSWYARLKLSYAPSATPKP